VNTKTKPNSLHSYIIMLMTAKLLDYVSILSDRKRVCYTM